TTGLVPADSGADPLMEVAPSSGKRVTPVKVTLTWLTPFRSRGASVRKTLTVPFPLSTRVPNDPPLQPASPTPRNVATVISDHPRRRLIMESIRESRPPDPGERSSA